MPRGIWALQKPLAACISASVRTSGWSRSTSLRARGVQGGSLSVPGATSSHCWKTELTALPVGNPEREQPRWLPGHGAVICPPPARPAAFVLLLLLLLPLLLQRVKEFISDRSGLRGGKSRRAGRTRYSLPASGGCLVLCFVPTPAFAFAITAISRAPSPHLALQEETVCIYCLQMFSLDINRQKLQRVRIFLLHFSVAGVGAQQGVHALPSSGLKGMSG